MLGFKKIAIYYQLVPLLFSGERDAPCPHGRSLAVSHLRMLREQEVRQVRRGVVSI